jgi:hypothetical protein
MRAGRYEDEARHTPQALSPPLIVARTRDATWCCVPTVMAIRG